MTAPAAARVCQSCRTALSRFNTSLVCGPCTLATDRQFLGMGRKRGGATYVNSALAPGVSALPRTGYRPMIAYLEELKQRLMLLGGESDDPRAVEHVIRIMEREAAVR